MQSETALLWWWLNILDHRRYILLKDRFGGLDEALKHLTPELLRALNMREDSIRNVFVRIESFDPARYLFELARRKVDLLTIEDERYPRMLREIGDPPVFISMIGNMSALDAPLVGMVGTRAMSTYGERVVETLTSPIVRAGYVTVSGLALGVDAKVALETMRAGGRTIAVLGNGLAGIYPPSNKKIAEDIVRGGGLLVSEFPLEVQPDKYTFPARNRIIAGLSSATIVCEAPEESGSVITAELALEYGRDVFAVPGQMFDENYAGCHRLIAEGRARLVYSVPDLLRELGADGGMYARPSYAPQTPEEESVFRALTAMPQTVDDLAQHTGLDASRIGMALTMMELSGAVRSLGGGQWVRQ